MARNFITKYNAKFAANLSNLEIELACIRRGGQWIDEDDTCGLGLFHHYREAQTLCWPEDDHHRWSDLILSEILQNTITVFMGPKDSSKTHSCAKYALIDYWAFPATTLILISSTDVRGLELRVWGAMKALIQRARERYPWLPGKVIDSKHCVSTDDIEQQDIRDMRKGIICFVKGTMVDTPSGPKPIETIKIGDKVLNAIGVGTVTETQQTQASELVRVTLSNGNKIICTPEHPFLTSRGWIKAIGLSTFDRVYSAYETMRIMQRPARTGIPQPQILLGTMSRQASCSPMRFLRKDFQTCKTQGVKARKLGSLLQYNLCEPMGGRTQIVCGTSHKEMSSLRQDHGGRSSESRLLLSILSQSSRSRELSFMRQEVHFDSTELSGQNSFLQQILQSEMDQPSNGETRKGCYKARENSGGPFSAGNYSSYSEHWHSDTMQCPKKIHSGFGVLTRETQHRIGWWVSSNSTKTDDRCKTRCNFTETWVESVEILKPGSQPEFDSSTGTYPVFNLSVAGHPSYSVNGIIVHNCIPCLSSAGQYIGGLAKYAGIKQKRRRLLGDELQFMRAAYLDVPANMNAGDFKGIFLGNPLGIGDPLDKVAEPKDGWASLEEPTKTAIWQNRWLDGHTVNLVGTDSPNFDFPQNKPAKYPYLINQKSIDRTVAFYGKDSLQYYSQCLGVRRAGLTAHRVITREMCEQFGAFEDVIWRGTKRTKVYGADIAYGGVGGDRCVGGWVEFGDDVDGNLILRINQHVIIPVSIRHKKIPEDQIAEFIKADCEANGIPPENVFYDSTGRGTMGTAFARIWSAFVNPVEFGGVPTPKPVCSDMYIFDVKTRENRLKRSDEHYSKRVTELWFNVRYAIESRQIRNLSQEVAEEGYLREWGMTRGDKIELETKADMKERIGHSPDLFDWLAVCIHGALQRGFSISKLGGKEDSADGPIWFKDLLDKSRKLNHAHDLVYADRLN